VTGEDERLDPTIFRSTEPLKLYRIARLKYANLSGVGAALYPGRWNRLGQEAIYTSTDPGTPVLERLVHTPKTMIPSNLAIMQILLRRSSDSPETQIKAVSNRNWMLICPTLKYARDAFQDISSARLSKLIALALPSVVTSSWNVVLYPDSPGFWDRVSLHNVKQFEFDPRLFPEHTPSE